VRARAPFGTGPVPTAGADYNRPVASPAERNAGRVDPAESVGHDQAHEEQHRKADAPSERAHHRPRPRRAGTPAAQHRRTGERERNDDEDEDDHDGRLHALRLSAAVWRAPRLRPGGLGRAVVLVAALAAAALTAWLGLWQWHRASEKQAVEAMLESRASLAPVGAVELASAARQAVPELLYRHVQLRGRWVDDRTIFLDNRGHGGRAGFIVVTPLAFDGGVVLVQRGWAARDNDDRTRLPTVHGAGGEVEVIGRVAPPPSRLYEFDRRASGTIRQNLDPADFARETGLALLPVSVQQTGGVPDGDGLLRQWPRPAADAHKNLGYAAQWWALCLLIVGLYVWYQIVRPRLRRRAG